MVLCLKATINNISVISWRAVLLVDETWENHQPAASHWQLFLFGMQALDVLYQTVSNVR